MDDAKERMAEAFGPRLESLTHTLLGWVELQARHATRIEALVTILRKFEEGQGNARHRSSKPSPGQSHGVTRYASRPARCDNLCFLPRRKRGWRLPFWVSKRQVMLPHRVKLWFTAHLPQSPVESRIYPNS